jgi:hypothetical protein
MDDAAWLNRAVAAQTPPHLSVALQARILGAFDDVTARRNAGFVGALRRLADGFRDAVWPGAPAWRPAAVLALSLVIGAMAGTFIPFEDVLFDNSEQHASVALDAPPAFDLDETS